MYLFCNSRIHVITLYSDHVCVYYASMLQCWQLVWILVRADHPCLGVGCHTYGWITCWQIVPTPPTAFVATEKGIKLVLASTLAHRTQQARHHGSLPRWSCLTQLGGGALHWLARLLRGQQ
jgi:hypothetical protein